jgi:hypothetical protein
VSDRNVDYRGMNVLPCLPHRRGEAEMVPLDLEGAKIIRIGAAPLYAEIEGGGLIIDYMPKNSRSAKRVVFGFNESAMWVVSS